MEDRGRGFIIILSAPSGTGKSTLATHLVENLNGVSLSISTTTRKPRGKEVDGVAYHFIHRDLFLTQKNRGDFLEWAEVFGNFYGTARENVESVLNRGEDLLLDIDWQGAEQVRANMPSNDVVSIFILPPSKDLLQKRLSDRKTDDADVIEKRMDQAGREISHWHEYDYLLVNDDLIQAQSNLVSIVTAERMRREHAAERIKSILSTFS